ncbi:MULTISPECIES: hypothetical protein [Halorussus]|uniref:hypothetical protein n=1 Tax=Halorussus TaxID=1070314 RepID=UPI0020A105E9|nr:hypothetical protein [Halorussus vallis]USZ78141.1 hypothetical protein NGM07_21010 [Halorussus vallis]
MNERIHARTIHVTADLELEVPRGRDGTLQDGITAVLRRSAAVERTEVAAVRGVKPTLNDLQVDATVRLTVRLDESVDDERAAVRETVADQFGVRSISEVREAKADRTSDDASGGAASSEVREEREALRASLE